MTLAGQKKSKEQKCLPAKCPEKCSFKKNHYRLLTTESKLFVSIMAGIKMETLAGNLKTVVGSPRIIRVHPNTPAMVGAGCAVFSLGEGMLIQITKSRKRKPNRFMKIFA